MCNLRKVLLFTLKKWQDKVKFVNNQNILLLCKYSYLKISFYNTALLISINITTAICAKQNYTNL